MDGPFAGEWVEHDPVPDILKLHDFRDAPEFSPDAEAKTLVYRVDEYADSPQFRAHLVTSTD
jgi:hypothetical protein